MDREWLDLDASPRASSLHVLPCAIKYDGPVDGSKFEVEEQPKLIARLRGRPLEGRLIDLDAYGYIGYTLEKKTVEARGDSGYENSDYGSDHGSDRGSDEEEDNVRDVRLVPKQCFDKIVVWEHGSEPRDSDTWVKIQELMALSKCLDGLATDINI